jgi:hypothetical protein
MTLRMHRVSTARWEQLAQSRRPIDLVEEERAEARSGKRHAAKAEHAAIQAQVDAISARRVRASR